jgi:hypothetical protein
MVEKDVTHGLGGLSTHEEHACTAARRLSERARGSIAIPWTLDATRRCVVQRKLYCASKFVNAFGPRVRDGWWVSRRINRLERLGAGPERPRGEFCDMGALPSIVAAVTLWPAEPSADTVDTEDCGAPADGTSGGMVFAGPPRHFLRIEERGRERRRQGSCYRRVHALASLM